MSFVKSLPIPSSFGSRKLQQELKPPLDDSCAQMDATQQERVGYGENP